MNIPGMGYTISFVKDKNKASSPQSYPICHTSHRPAREFHNPTLAPAHLRVLIQDYFLKRRCSYFENFKHMNIVSGNCIQVPCPFGPPAPCIASFTINTCSLKSVAPFFLLMNLRGCIIISTAHSLHLSSFLLYMLQIWTSHRNYHSITQSSFMA